MKLGSISLVLALLSPAGAARAQTTPLPPAAELIAFLQRVVQLMESTTAVVPGLARAGEPVIENARQSLVVVRENPQNSRLFYDFLANVRAYVALADALPKPHPFPEEGRRQFAALRETSDQLSGYFAALLDIRESALRNPDRDNLRRYAEENMKLGPPSAESPRVVFLGDSITAGWRLNEYFPDRDFVNRGIGGQITGEMLGRFMADVVNLKPSAVHILAGTNDIARGVPLQIMQQNYLMMADLADHHKIKVVIGAVLPVHDFNKAENPAWEQTRRRPIQTIRALNAYLEKLCDQRHYAYVNYYGHMLDADGFLRKELARDGLHPNADGYRVMAPLALNVLDKLAAPVAPEKRRRRFLF